MKRWVLVLAAVTALAALPAAAETLYVIDWLYVALRDGPAGTAAVLKTLETGAKLEVLERVGSFVRVRDGQGAEGWMDARYLSAEPPARQQLTAVREELARARTELKALRSELVRARSRLESSEATLAQDKRGKDAMVADHRTGKARTEQLVGSFETAATPLASLPTASPQGLSWSSFLWLAVCFAMLGIGFALGVFWLREHNRKKLGGMYLRI